MAQIFISHSKRDTELVANVSLIIENLGHKPVIEELIPEEKKKQIPYEEIRSNVEMSWGVLCFLTKEVMRTEYTRNWVMFEISLSAGLNKRLFVFEHVEDIEEMDYPVPYLSDYMVFDKDSASDLLEAQRHIKELIPKPSGGQEIPPALAGGGLGLLAGLPFGPLGLILGGLGGATLGALATPTPQGVPPRLYTCLKCVFCGTPFNYHSPDVKRFRCPTCRRWIETA